ncbi:hypothetical protein [Klebsiella pneumoniae]|uniref:hypothetical protein n=1 Tax=Klebsiella pneumoniae TaxID=573 RepID=UPI000E2E2A08|nr:hypothetical protein [Klebsiella pneumoniae]SVK85519.1 Uncharacterised protein [Klebsiella pneumoniae]SYV76222.1 Uncharacterised protein [Klebsiella pneumoniae]
MTDITELTSVQKNANIHRLSRLIAYAPNDELRQMAVEVEHYTDQLIEALEKEQAKADVYDMLRDDYGLREKGVGLADFVDWQAKCIAELESRTVNVKLPTTIEPTAFSPWVAKAFYQFHKDTVKSCFAVFSDACAAAGIKVEAE